jgi:protein TonB
MFDSVGKDTHRSAKRQSTAFLMSLVTVSATSAFIYWATSRVIEEVIEADEVVEVPVTLAAPPPPPPPPPPGGNRPKTEKKKPDEIKPQEVPQEIVPLEPPPTEAPPEEAGEEGGQEGGEVGGQVGGTVGGDVKNGVLGGQLGGTGTDLKAVHYSEVKYKVRPSDKYPDSIKSAAAAMGFDDEKCMVTIEIDESGKPTQAEASKCNEIFKQAAIDAAMGSEFYPYIDPNTGQPIKVKFTWVFRYRLK